MATRKHLDRHAHLAGGKAAARNPKWWTGEHDAAWDRVKEAFRHDLRIPDEDWARGEPAFRYGHAAQTHYKDFPTWSEGLEERLQIESMNLGRNWEQDRDFVRRAFDWRPT
jgi:hypothetical protein